MHWEARMRGLAAAQDGVVGIRQMQGLGLGSDHWWRARRNGRWTLLSRRVQRLDGSSETDRQRVMAALLDAAGGAILHGPSALAWAGLRGFNLSCVHVTRTRGATVKPCELAEVHWLRHLRPVDKVIIRGVPTVSPVRAIWSEASRFSHPALFERGVARVGRIVDDAHRMGLVTWRQLHAAVDELGKRGRAGTSIMRELASKRVPGSSPTESRLEDRFEAVTRDAGIPAFVRQVPVGDNNDLIGRTDFHHRDLPLVVEVNSLAFHSTPSDQRSDEERYALLVGAGFTVVVVWEDDLWSNTYSVEAAVTRGQRASQSDHAEVIHSASCPWPSDPHRIQTGASGPPHRG